jgi:ABC-type phosphonate transport system ATPase subunit
VTSEGSTAPHHYAWCFYACNKFDKYFIRLIGQLDQSRSKFLTERFKSEEENLSLDARIKLVRDLNWTVHEQPPASSRHHYFNNGGNVPEQNLRSCSRHYTPVIYSNTAYSDYSFV